MKTKHFLLTVTAALAVIISFTTCSPDDDEKDVVIEQTNNTVTVTDGGEITCGDVTVNFPKGTFSSNAEVKVGMMRKGAVLGNDEVTPFYKITMPVATEKSLKISIRSDEHGDDINVVARTPGYYLSEDELTDNDVVLPSTYADGEYVVTIPKSGNKGEDGTIDMSIGLAHVGGWKNSDKSRTRAWSDSNGETFSEGDVSWKFNFSPAFKAAHSGDLELHYTELNDIIREAIKKLHGLGLAVTKRTINMSFNNLMKEDGRFVQNQFCNEWSTVEFNASLLSDFDNRKDQLRRSAIHELMHDFQADYDKRSCFRKAKAVLKGWDYVYSLTYESGAVWAEQFMGGSFSNEFVKGYAPYYLQGYDLRDEVYKTSPYATTSERYASHGYAMSLVIQYMTRNMTEDGLNDKSITDLYKIWKSTGNYAKECINQLTRSKKNTLFALDHYDKFLLSLFQGEVTKGFTIKDVEEMTQSGGTIGDNFKEKENTNKCYPFGCQIFRYPVNITSKTLLDEKDLVVEQLEEGVQTYVLINDKNVEREGFTARKGSPITISGKELKKNHYKSDLGKTSFILYVVTTTKDNETGKPLKVKVSLCDAPKASISPTELNFTADGGSKDVTFITQGYKYCGCTLPAADKTWLSAKFSDDRVLTFTAQPNTTGKARSTEIKCHVYNDPGDKDSRYYMPLIITQEANTNGGKSNIHATDFIDFLIIGMLSVESGATTLSQTLSMSSKNMSFKQSGSTLHVSGSQTSGSMTINVSFDIVNFTGDCKNCVIRNLNYSESTNTYELTTILDNIPIKTGSIGNTGFSHMKFESKVSQGLSVVSYSYKWKNGSSINRVYKKSADDYARIEFNLFYTLDNASRQADGLTQMP